ncbi:hypothetical protein CLOP_g12472 [Closterium sp. NIES-67]|nr:hypothetical protein CLOP_g12472 [Closterium sp. NIES-67]
MESYQAMRDSLLAHLAALHGEARRQLPAAMASAQVACTCLAAVLALVVAPLGAWIAQQGMGLKLVYGFVLGLACSLLYASLSMRNARQRRKKAVVLRRLDWEMSLDEVLRVAGFAEGNCTSSCQKLHSFQLAWVNSAVRQMWPHIRQAATSMLQGSLRDLFEGYHFGIITGIDVRSVDLGPDPPTITEKRQAEKQVKAEAEARVQGEGSADAEAEEARAHSDGTRGADAETKEAKEARAKSEGRGGSEEGGEGAAGDGAEGSSGMEGAEEVVVEVAVEWTEGQVQERQLRMHVQTAMSPDVDVRVGSIAAAATLKLTLKPLLPVLPGFGTVLLSLLHQPFFNFTVSVQGGNLKAMPGFEKMIETVLRLSIDDSLVWPSRWVYPVMEGDFSFLELTPVGYLDVSLIEAADLPKTDVLTGAADPFVLLYVRQREGAIKRSSTVHHSRHPVWNEGFILEVEDPASQQLTIRVMDSERFEKSEFIGAHMLHLSQLHVNKAQDLWLDLYDKPETPESASTHGRVHVVVMYVPYTKREGGVGTAEGTEGGETSKEQGKTPEGNACNEPRAGG